MKTLEKLYRGSKFYKSLTPYMAVAIAEGFCEGEGATMDEQLCAWQYIWDKGLWKGLQGFFGRQVHALVEAGSIAK